MSDNTRRDFVRKAIYVAPVILTLGASPEYAKAGSVKDGDRNGNGHGNRHGNGNGNGHGHGNVHDHGNRKGKYLSPDS